MSDPIDAIADRADDKETGPVTNRLHALENAGQAVWLDFVDRKFMREGGLEAPRRGGRPDRGHLQPDDLREGDRPLRRL